MYSGLEPRADSASVRPESHHGISDLFLLPSVFIDGGQ
jgi:hypothetical protein